jgi:hypothetical protein
VQAHDVGIRHEGSDPAGTVRWMLAKTVRLFVALLLLASVLLVLLLVGQRAAAVRSPFTAAAGPLAFGVPTAAVPASGSERAVRHPSLDDVGLAPTYERGVVEASMLLSRTAMPVGGLHGPAGEPGTPASVAGAGDAARARTATLPQRRSRPPALPPPPLDLGWGYDRRVEPEEGSDPPDGDGDPGVPPRGGALVATLDLGEDVVLSDAPSSYLPKMTVPPGAQQLDDGTYLLPDRTRLFPYGISVLPDGRKRLHDNTMVYPTDTVMYPDGLVIWPDGTVVTADGVRAHPDGLRVPAASGDAIFPEPFRRYDGRLVLTTGTTIAPDDTIEFHDSSRGLANHVRVYPGGRIVTPDGVVWYPDDRRIYPDGTERLRDVSMTFPNGNRLLFNGTRVLADDTWVLPNGTFLFSDGTSVTAEGTIRLPGNVEVLADATIVLGDGATLRHDGTLVLADGTPAPPGHGHPDITSVSAAGVVELRGGVRVHPDRHVELANGAQLFADARRVRPDGTEVWRDGTLVFTDGGRVLPNRTWVARDGTRLRRDGTWVLTDGTEVWQNGTVVDPDRSRRLPSGERWDPDGRPIAPAPDDDPGRSTWRPAAPAEPPDPTVTESPAEDAAGSMLAARAAFGTPDGGAPAERSARQAAPAWGVPGDVDVRLAAAGVRARGAGAPVLASAMAVEAWEAQWPGDMLRAVALLARRRTAWQDVPFSGLPEAPDVPPAPRLWYGNQRDGTHLLPDGTRMYPDGTQLLADRTYVLADGTKVFWNGLVVWPDETIVFPNGYRMTPYGFIKPPPDTTVVRPDDTVELADGSRLTRDLTLVHPGGKVVFADGVVRLAEGTRLFPGGSRMAPDRTLHLPNGNIVLQDGTVLRQFTSGLLAPPERPGSTAAESPAGDAGAAVDGGLVTANEPPVAAEYGAEPVVVAALADREGASVAPETASPAGPIRVQEQPPPAAEEGPPVADAPQHEAEVAARTGTTDHPDPDPDPGATDLPGDPGAARLSDDVALDITDEFGDVGLV